MHSGSEPLCAHTGAADRAQTIAVQDSAGYKDVSRGGRGTSCGKQESDFRRRTFSNRRHRSEPDRPWGDRSALGRKAQTDPVNVGGPSYGRAMETTEPTSRSSIEQYWAQVQALRDDLARLRTPDVGPRPTKR
jgi:hypothetical protein